MKKSGWLLIILLCGLIAALETKAQAAPVLRYLYPLVIAMMLSIIKIFSGPAPVERVLALAFFNFTAAAVIGVIAVFDKSSFLMDIAIAWIFQSFITTLAFAKYISTRKPE